MSYHVPVMLKECIEALDIKPEGIYVDVTFGGGGHSRAIMERLSTGKLVAFDQDEDAKENTWEDNRLVFVHENFRYLKKYLRLYNLLPVDGILADLGISSYQIDTAKRGFSIRFDAALDMRMDQSSTLTAADVVNTYSAADLQELFSKYGEVRNARTLAQTIVEAREVAPIQTIEDFKRILEPLSKGNPMRYLAQVFQALRIEVNKELEVLEQLLKDATEVLAPKGRLVVLSYHSLEDRLVKNFIKAGNAEGVAEKDLYGKTEVPLVAVNRKPIEASTEEQKRNPRSRSAKLRIAEKR
ncbi:MAG: 16S rRNA (cytosine(1402)-N(4))-methyltransferase RsmH [Chitinophagales bacterium]|nr:16S rRNA (cytosine(1402)-N(4))-methyltransferase RsmH [Chitinophagales bacterium]